MTEAESPETPTERPRTAEVRATVNLPGFRAGTYQTVYPDDPYIAKLIEHGKLVVE